jgi:acyl dehydratase
MPPDLQPGAALGPHAIHGVPAASMTVMTAILDDPNPIHLDAGAVRALGLGDRRINQGPVNLGYVADMLAGDAPGATIQRLEVRFLANVFEGDVVVATGVVEGRTDDGVVRCTVQLDREHAGPALVGTAVLRHTGTVDDQSDAS